MGINKLDNPAWYSLSETHSHFAIDCNGMLFYQPEYCPFGGYIDSEKTPLGIDQYALLTRDFYVIGAQPDWSDKVYLNKELICNQMVLNQPIALELSEEITALQTSRQQSDLFELVNLVQPGYFKPHTSALGSYFGIYKDNQLVAVTGERMKMDGYTEISAVVTHPEHTGKGYAKQLVAHTSAKVFGENRIPYLHVAATNTGAIQLYEKLGFSTRRTISFWNIRLLDS